MKAKSSLPLSPSADLLEAKALTIRIKLLETSFRACARNDEMQRYLLQLELANAYQQLMKVQECTRQLILLSKVS